MTRDEYRQARRQVLRDAGWPESEIDKHEPGWERIGRSLDDHYRGVLAGIGHSNPDALMDCERGRWLPRTRMGRRRRETPDV